MDKLTKEDTERLRKCLQDMQKVSATFYSGATGCGNHAFIEFCGLMNEYIKGCEAALEKGIDFTHLNKHAGSHIPVKSHFAAYLGEKLDCIYGPELAKAALATIKE